MHFLIGKFAGTPAWHCWSTNFFPARCGQSTHNGWHSCIDFRNLAAIANINSSEISTVGLVTIKQTLLRILRVHLCAFGVLSASLNAQTLDVSHPGNLAGITRYFNAFEIVQSVIFEEVLYANASPDSVWGKDLLRESLIELAQAPASHYLTPGNHLAMLGPYRVFESRATPGLIATLYREQLPQTSNAALRVSGILPPLTVAVLERGRQFNERLLAIYISEDFADKSAEVDKAVQDYLNDDEHSVPPHPKSANLLLRHPFAYAFRVGFPQFSGLLWSAQWLYLATVETLLLTDADAEVRQQALAHLQARYADKLHRPHSSFMTLPTDIPTMPAIAPTVFARHPAAAMIVDNIAMLKLVIGDILAHPDAPDRTASINAITAQFVDKENNLEDQMRYTIFALRGGIFNQGGPAMGEMEQPERSHSRESLQAPPAAGRPMIAR